MQSLKRPTIRGISVTTCASHPCRFAVLPQLVRDVSQETLCQLGQVRRVLIWAPHPCIQSSGQETQDALPAHAAQAVPAPQELPKLPRHAALSLPDRAGAAEHRGHHGGQHTGVPGRAASDVPGQGELRDTLLTNMQGVPPAAPIAAHVCDKQAPSVNPCSCPGEWVLVSPVHSWRRCPAKKRAWLLPVWPPFSQNCCPACCQHASDRAMAPVSN